MGVWGVIGWMKDELQEPPETSIWQDMKSKNLMRQGAAAGLTNLPVVSPPPIDPTVSGTRKQRILCLQNQGCLCSNLPASSS